MILRTPSTALAIAAALSMVAGCAGPSRNQDQTAAAANSKFTPLQIGMSLKQVTDFAGQPTDSGAYVTDKAFIPFYSAAIAAGSNWPTRARDA